MINLVKRFITLQHTRFRRVFLVVVSLVVVVLMILSASFPQPFGPVLGTQITQAAVLLLLVVLVEHVANSTDRFQALEASVDNLKTSVGEIRTSIGVREGIEIYKTDYVAVHKQREFVASRKPEKAQLCEYSSITVNHLLIDLAGADSTRSVDLLVCHPDAALNDFQRDERILPQMRALANSITLEQARNMGLKIRCYEEPPSLRGRVLDDELVVFGLYTNDRRSHPTTEPQLWGAENPVVMTFRTQPYGKIMADWFDEVFARLWKDATPLQQALSGYQAGKSIDPDWLRQVSS
jgi:hypothetical protein